MAGVCTDYFSTLPMLDVVAMCARQIAEQTTSQVNGAETLIRNLDHLTALVIAAAVLIGPILFVRLLALVQAIGLIAWRARGARRPPPPRRERLIMDAIAERKSGRAVTATKPASLSGAR